jgi:hypothetical protein
MKREWSEAKVAKLIAEGYGAGSGPDYKPWINVRDISSRGRKHLVPCARLGRSVHLLSDIEYHLFLLLEWSDAVLDINEQYPLDRDLTQDVARKLGIRHPCYPGTHVPTVMTVDFMVTLMRDGKQATEVFNAKSEGDTEDERQMEKLEIARTALALMDIPHHIVLDTMLPKQKVKNLEWLQGALVKPGEKEPSEGYYDEMAARFMLHGAGAAAATPTKALSKVCGEFDCMHNAEPGTGLRVARILMRRKEIGVDLGLEQLHTQPVSALQFATRKIHMVAVGGKL